MLLDEQDPVTNRDLKILRLGDKPEVLVLLATPFDETTPEVFRGGVGRKTGCVSIATAMTNPSGDTKYSFRPSFEQWQVSTGRRLAAALAWRVVAWGGAVPVALSGEILPAAGPATDEAASEERIRAMQERLRGELAAGGLGIGVGINYTPGAARLEMIEIFRVAAERGVPLWPHIRAAGYTEPGSSVESVAEVIAAAAVTGAPLHIVHINSMGLGQVFECLRMIEGARAHGLDVTIEAYPYGWGRPCSTPRSSTRAGASACGSTTPICVWWRRGSRCRTRASIGSAPRAGRSAVLVRGNPDERVDAVIRHPLVMVASDGFVSGGKGHPRTAGT